MKFVIVFSLCSAISNYCGNPSVYPKKFDSWTECHQFAVKKMYEKYNVSHKKFNEEKLFLKYFCHENQSDKTSVKN